VQHLKNQTGQPLSVKIVSEKILTINQVKDMLVFWCRGKKLQNSRNPD
jgi:hypothetical protein